MRQPAHSLYLMRLAQHDLSALVAISGAFYWDGRPALKECYSPVLLCLASRLSLSGWLHRGLNDRLPGLIAKIILDETRVSSLTEISGIVLIDRLRPMPFSLAGIHAGRLLS